MKRGSLKPCHGRYDAFELPSVAPQTAIDSIASSDKGVPAWLASWKRLREEGWNVTVIIAPDSKRLIGLGSRGSIHLTLKHDPPLHSARLLQTLGATWKVDPDAPGACPCCGGRTWANGRPVAAA